jgi:hypothetical protein
VASLTDLEHLEGRTKPESCGCLGVRGRSRFNGRPIGSDPAIASQSLNIFENEQSLVGDPDRWLGNLPCRQQVNDLVGFAIQTLATSPRR